VGNFRLDLAEGRFIWRLALVVFPVVLVIALVFGNCDVRRRGDKHACRDGAAERCVAVGDFYIERRVGLFNEIFDNEGTARDAYQRACELGNRAGCAGYGRWGYGDDATAALDKACDNGSGDQASCDLFVERAPRRASALRAKQCDQGNNDRCIELGTELLEGSGSDSARGAALLAKACDRASWQACFDLGESIVDSDPARGIEILTKACDHGHKDACFELGKVLLATDKDRAMKIFTAGCERDDRACDALGDIYRVDGDRARADSFYKQACSSGGEFYCKKQRCLHHQGDSCWYLQREQKQRRFRLGGDYDMRDE